MLLVMFRPDRNCSFYHFKISHKKSALLCVLMQENVSFQGDKGSPGVKGAPGPTVSNFSKPHN